MAKATDSVRAAIYCRVSTEEQARPDKVSLEVQRSKAKDYCKAQGWEVAEIFEDAGESGTKADRPALAAMLAGAAEGRFQRVVFQKIDRFGRNLRDLLDLAHRLDALGVGIISIAESFDTSTPPGRLFFSLLGAFAEFERDRIAERIAMGKLGQAKKGNYNTGWAPYGFDYDPATRKLVVNEAEADVVRRIYRWYLRDGLSQRKIVERLNAEGVATKTDHVRSADGRKKGWWKGQIGRMLTNSRYRGESYFAKTRLTNGKKTPVPIDEWVPIDTPAIVSEEEWKAVQAKAKRNKGESRRPKDAVSTYVLSGLIRCEPCGYPMHGYTQRKMRGGTKKEWRYYTCYGQHKYNFECRSSYRVNADRIERAVLGSIVEAYSDPEKLLGAVSAYNTELEAVEEDREGLTVRLRRNLDRATEQRERVVTRWADAGLRDSDLKRQLERIERDVAGWEEELRRLDEASERRAEIDEIEKTARSIAERIAPTVEELTLEEKKTLLRSLVDRVWLGAANEISIECVVPNLLREGSKVATDNGVAGVQ